MFEIFHFELSVTSSSNRRRKVVKDVLITRNSSAQRPHSKTRNQVLYIIELAGNLSFFEPSSQNSKVSIHFIFTVIFSKVVYLSLFKVLFLFELFEYVIYQLFRSKMIAAVRPKETSSMCDKNSSLKSSSIADLTKWLSWDRFSDSKFM